MTEDTVTGEINLVWDVDEDAYFKFGAKLTSTERENDYSRSRYDGGALDLTLGTDAFVHWGRVY